MASAQNHDGIPGFQPRPPERKGPAQGRGLVYFPAQNSTPLAFGENHPVGGKLQDRTELNLTSAAAVDSFL
jgi:hypothetical protein